MIRKFFRGLAYFVSAIILLVLILFVIWYRSDIPVSELESKYLTSESSYINIFDSKVHVRQRGAGTPVILIHGSFASLHTWNDWEDELSKSFRTISMDLPGHGLTGPNRSRTYSTDYYESLVMQLATTMGIDTFYVAGNSMGGNVAWKMALHHPDRVKKLVLIDASGFGRNSSDTINKRTEPFIFKMIKSKMIGKMLAHITPRFLIGLNVKQVYGDDSKIREKDVDRFYDLLLREGNRDATLDRFNNAGRNLQDSIKFIDVPTLILWGEQDKWIPVAHASLFQSAIKNSNVIIYKTAGHTPMEEIPNETISDVKAFLAK